MYTCAFIDWENIERSARDSYGSVINYAEFVKVIRDTVSQKNSRLVSMSAYGDFDKGNAGLMTRLVTLGIEPKHVVTKTAHEYLKGSTDIELSLDVLDNMYRYPHVTDFLFISGDSDLRYVIRRLTKHGKNVCVMGFKNHTAKHLIEIVSNFIVLDRFPSIMRKETQSEKEKRAARLLADKFARTLLIDIDRLEKDGRSFVGLNNLHNRLKDHYPDQSTEISEWITECLEVGILSVYSLENPNDKSHPTRAIKINRKHPVLAHIIVADGGS